jgi:hypothetical protein
MDAAIDVLKKAIKAEDQIQAAHKIRTCTAQTQVVLYHRNEARGVGIQGQNFLKNPSTASDMWNIEDWWIKQ